MPKVDIFAKKVDILAKKLANLQKKLVKIPTFLKYTKLLKIINFGS